MKNYWKHFKLVMRHKYHVFMEMRRYGLYWQGLTHDLSKFSPIEFRQAKYYSGNKSPIGTEKRIHGYSISWLHHIHHNKHHWEYWYDPTAGKLAPIPERYMTEMVCDIVAASKAYNGKDWTPDIPINFVKNKNVHPVELKEILIPMLERHLGCR